MKKNISIILIMMICMLSFVACGGQDTKVYNAVKEEIKGNLKDEKSAKFASINDVLIIDENGTYYVLGSVEGKNSFGVMVSNYYEAYVTPNDGKYTVDEVNYLDDSQYESLYEMYSAKAERTKNGESMLSNEELEQELKNQDLYVTSTSITKKEDLYLASGDMISAVIKNNSNLNISEAVIAFAAWDSNNLPLKLKGSVDINDATYIKEVNYSNINMTPGSTYGEDSGFELDSDIHPAKARAIVVSYETTDGTKWTNPYYLDFIEANKGKEY